MSSELKNKIIDKLQEVGAVNPCPRCSHNEFEFVGVSNIQVNPDANLKKCIYNMPIAYVACKKCSYLSSHALVALGLVDPLEE
ncbi:hypothetical protein [Pseudomonas leptonychotis]|uniref:hypothetical protein n=1 Tax=Pseudomonas leptonychotis TaxID=2448482 RepID=UPI0039F02238